LLSRRHPRAFDRSMSSV
jgi:hypothetical protein